LPPVFMTAYIGTPKRMSRKKTAILRPYGHHVKGWHRFRRCGTGIG
jgi:hypothetical protein